ncbi:hypothetical protein WJX73_007817 [Symbiochloris irregularis]|uniref:Serine protease n=1 Tax=Symbiochloris irregularis TaxID=706552 RepID=A0AAW1NLI5_9CHLO
MLCNGVTLTPSVEYRLVSAAASAQPDPACQAAPGSATCIPTERREQAFELATEAVRRVEGNGQTYGTAVRIALDAGGQGIFATATHVCAAEGKLLPITIDGHEATLIASIPRYDIAFIRGPPGQCLELQESEPSKGSMVYLLGYSQAVDEEAADQSERQANEAAATSASTPSGQRTRNEPMMPVQGIMGAAVGASGCYGADYTGLPNYSGGPVMRITREGMYIVGVHTSALFHLDREFARSNTSKRKVTVEVAPFALVNKDPAAMFNGRLLDETPTSSFQAQHACANIGHKGSLGLLVSSASVIRLGELAGNVFPQPRINMDAPFGLAVASSGAKRVRRN